MSLVPRQEKKANATANMQQYTKIYREINREHLKTQERFKYYKNKYGLPQEFVKKYGEFSGDVFKIKRDIFKLHERCPEIIKHVLSDIVPSSTGTNQKPDDGGEM